MQYTIWKKAMSYCAQPLVIAWALEKKTPFLYCHCFTFNIDQKPLKTILNWSIGESRPCFQRIIKICPLYDFEVHYIKGKDNVLGGFMSHLSSGSDILCTSSIKLTRIFVSCVTSTVRARVMQIKLIMIDKKRYPIPAKAHCPKWLTEVYEGCAWDDLIILEL